MARKKVLTVSTLLNDTSVSGPHLLQVPPAGTIPSRRRISASVFWRLFGLDGPGMVVALGEYVREMPREGSLEDRSVDVGDLGGGTLSSHRKG